MIDWSRAHPNLASWLVLSAGFLAVLGWTARDVGLGAAQWLWLAVAAVLTAGLCAWIISWESDDEDDETDGADESEVPVEEGGA